MENHSEILTKHLMHILKLVLYARRYDAPAAFNKLDEILDYAVENNLFDQRRRKENEVA